MSPDAFTQLHRSYDSPSWNSYPPRYLSSVIVPGEELLVSDLILAQQDLL